MSDVFEECGNCPVKIPCKIRSGEIEPFDPYSCKPKIFLDRALNSSNIPKAYKSANIYNYSNMEDDNLTKNKLEKVIETIFGDVMNGRNICITGKKCGIGKTHTACVIMNHFIYKASQRLSPESPVALFIDYAYLIDKLRYSDDPEVEKLFDLAQKVPFLLLDDVGSCTMKDYVREQTFIVANSRSLNGLATMITSNYSTSELKSEDLLGARIQSRLTAGALVIEMKGSNRRLKGLKSV